MHVVWGCVGCRLSCPGGASSFLSLSLMPGPPALGFDPIRTAFESDLQVPSDQAHPLWPCSAWLLLPRGPGVW